MWANMVFIEPMALSASENRLPPIPSMAEKYDNHNHPTWNYWNCRRAYPKKLKQTNFSRNHIFLQPFPDAMDQTPCCDKGEVESAVSVESVQHCNGVHIEATVKARSFWLPSFPLWHSAALGTDAAYWLTSLPSGWWKTRMQPFL